MFQCFECFCSEITCFCSEQMCFFFGNDMFQRSSVGQTTPDWKSTVRALLVKLLHIFTRFHLGLRASPSVSEETMLFVGKEAEDLSIRVLDFECIVVLLKTKMNQCRALPNKKKGDAWSGSIVPRSVCGIGQRHLVGAISKLGGFGNQDRKHNRHSHPFPPF